MIIPPNLSTRELEESSVLYAVITFWDAAGE